MEKNLSLLGGTCITNTYKTITDTEILNKLSTSLVNISNEKLKSPGNLKSAIENNLVGQDIGINISFEELENLNAIHSFFIDALKVSDKDIIEKIKNPIDILMNKLISELNTYKDWIKEKNNAEKIRKEKEKQKKEAEEKRKKLEEDKKRLEDERKRLEEQNRRDNEEKRRLNEEKNRLEEERRKKDEERRREEEEKRKFKDGNTIYHNEVHDKTKPKLKKNELFYMDYEEKKGICYFLGINKILIESNSVDPNSDAYNVIRSDDVYYLSQDKENSYICFDFMRRKVRLDYMHFYDSQQNKYCLINFRVEGSNDKNNWVTLTSMENMIYGNSREAIGHFITLYQPYNEEYKCFFTYIRIVQTGQSYKTNNYVMGIRYIEFYGDVSEPIDI